MATTATSFDIRRRWVGADHEPIRCPKSGRREAMRKWVRSGLAFGLSMMVSLGVCDIGHADDTKAGNDSKLATAKATVENKPEAGLTDRERWLLERVEQLEKRVADLESKDGKPAGEATATTSGSNGMGTASKTAVGTPSATVASAPPVVVPGSMSASIAAA